MFCGWKLIFMCSFDNPFRFRRIKKTEHISVADTGFPVGGHDPHSGAWTPEAAAFRKF